MILDNHVIAPGASVNIQNSPLYIDIHDLINAYFGNVVSALIVPVDCITIG